MPQSYSQTSIHHHVEEQDDAVTHKTPKALVTRGDTSDESTSAEEIKSDEGTADSEDASPIYTSSSDSEVEYLKSTQNDQVTQIKQCVPSTPDRPSGPLLEERNITTKSAATNSQQRS